MSNSFKKRIDELGRIVIPKEIRKNYKIKDWDELSLICNDDGILIKRADSLLNYVSFFNILFSLINEFLECELFIILNDEVVSSTNNECGIVDNSFIKNYDIKRKNQFIVDNNLFVNNKKISGYILVEPIIADSNYYGSLLMLNSKFNEKDSKILKKIINLISDLLI